MRIIVDAMGGDNAPAAVVKGAVDAQAEFGVDVVLVGRQAEVEACLKDCAAAENPHITLVHAESVIDMHDDPAMACRRKKDSSMSVALRMLAEGGGDAVISAGSTGALLTGATLLVTRIRGVRPAAFAPVLPHGGKGVVLID
jgi:glycerol-3-phosphate acyltransferase PlsX